VTHRVQQRQQLASNRATRTGNQDSHRVLPSRIRGPRALTGNRKRL
jgi:hypothetical protein